MKFLKPRYIADSMSTPIFFSSISLGSSAKSSIANGPNAPSSLVKWNIIGSANMGFFPDSRFIKRLFRYDVSVIQRPQRLNVLSAGNTDGLLPSQQNIFISLICLSLYRNKKYFDFTADIVWTIFSFSRALKSAVSSSLICRSYLLFFELLFNCCFLFLICLIFLGSSDKLFEW